MISGTVTNRYTQGLFSFAESHGAINVIDGGLRHVVEVLQAHPELQALFEHPVITPAEKSDVASKIFGGQVDSNVLRFLDILFARRRSAYISGIYARFHGLAEAARGEFTIQVESARELKADEVRDIESKMSAALNKQAHAAVAVNPDLIAGYRVQAGNRVLDATVRGALEQFSQKLVGGAAKEGTL